MTSSSAYKLAASTMCVAAVLVAGCGSDAPQRTQATSSPTESVQTQGVMPKPAQAETSDLKPPPKPKPEPPTEAVTGGGEGLPGGGEGPTASGEPVTGGGEGLTGGGED